MAEAITYADLRFVKAPLKKAVSIRLGPGDVDEDGELTYENVQVPSAPGGLPNSAASGLEDKAGAVCEQPTTSWRFVTSPAARQILRCHASRTQYFILSLLLTCLLLGVASICLGVRYLQVSEQLQQKSRVLEATDSSLKQQLSLKIRQLGQMEEDLQGARRELAHSQESLGEEEKALQATKEELQECRSDREKTKEALQREEQQKMNLDQRLRETQSTLKPFFTCTSPGKRMVWFNGFRENMSSTLDTCCPVGWILNERSCFYFSPTKKNWESSRNHCKFLSSDLATFHGNSEYNANEAVLDELLQSVKDTSYWIGLKQNGYWKWIDGARYSNFGSRYSTGEKCGKATKTTYWSSVNEGDCKVPLFYICKMQAFRYPDGEHSLH
ncbi:B-cell differentiation antigen CD72 isoform X1 [Erinaceus europaeus]|uniref:B-cell differentiation antigen CD72 isoform X1 n=2 Tax=Erinaceus europaeus TaxID=9365 RepID=A0ABM3Y298_ERIEU|nr:B-cell differentiation antigen CD72 isoform X1 [Erinaceus europaeus]